MASRGSSVDAVWLMATAMSDQFKRTQPTQLTLMFLRINKLPVELPASPEVDPISARNVQELLGGRFGEMSTLMN